MKEENYQITIHGEEKNKNEIIYNNIIENMEMRKVPKDEQIEYLKSKISYLESSNRNKVTIFLFILFGIACFVFGIFLILSKLQVLGIIFLSVGFFIPMTKLLIVIYKNDQRQNSKYSEVERLKNILNAKLK